MKIKLRIVLPVFFGIVLVLTLFNMVSNRRIYSEAQAMLEEGMILEAKATFETIADYKDSTDMIKECDYRRAAQKLENEEFSSCITLYGRIKGYKDADALCKEAYNIWFDKCISLYQEGNIVRGTLMCQKLKEKAGETHKGMSLKASWLLLIKEAGYEGYPNQG